MNYKKIITQKQNRNFMKKILALFFAIFIVFAFSCSSFAYVEKDKCNFPMYYFEDASKTFFQIIKRNPNYYKAYLGIAMSLDKLEHYSEAIRYYKKFLGLKQFSEDALFARQRIKELKDYLPVRTNKLELVH